MFLRVFFIVLIYLLLGVGVLEIMLWHDRNCDWIHEWIDDESMQVLVVVFMPFYLLLVILWLLYIGILKFIKAVRVLFTTLIYTVISLIKGENKNEN